MAELKTPASFGAVSLAGRYRQVREFTKKIVAPLSAEDCMIQSMPDASPIRWHMAHTSWFFETFILSPLKDYEVFDDEFRYLFNSYYNAVGDQFPRPERGLISRPGLGRVRDYREYIDRHMLELLSGDDLTDELLNAIDIGLNHEQQHQELMLTDIKHAFSCNPTLPQYQTEPIAASSPAQPRWFDFEEGLFTIGNQTEGFAFDNELPPHKNYQQAYSIASRPVSCGDYIEFIDAGGYRDPGHWLSLGWTMVEEKAWSAPLYWLQRDGQWMVFTLAGLVPVNPDWPLCHISYFEADAYARWAGARLPTEFEWEVASHNCGGTRFADRLMDDNNAVHPVSEKQSSSHPSQMFGGVWEWTSSSYAAYPGYTAPDGAFGEYNGKFMCNQYVLRGGSVATVSDHIRSSYRNFFPPETRWQFSGLRLAK
jgi:ergothioneine biosynthesis protein EgtB